MKLVKNIRILWVSILTLTVIFLLWQFIAPLGKIKYVSNFSKYTYFISELTPKDRVGISQNKINNLVIGEPVYFYLRTLRPFSKAIVTINYTNPSSLMELGICRDKAHWNFERLPIYFDALEKLALTDNVLIENGLLLWQKQKNYVSVADFLQNPPALEKMGVYNYSVTSAITLEDYKALPSSKNFMLGAKGSYSLITYSNGEPISITFDLRKKNTKKKESSSMIATLYSMSGEVVETKNVSWPYLDDENEIETKEFSITTKPLTPGAYRIEFKTDDSIETENLITNQSKLSVINSVQLSDFSRTNFSIFTDATNLSFQTINPKNVQRLVISGQSIDINETYKQFSLNLQDQTRAIKEIKLEKDDIMLAGDGVFALESEEIINPLPRQFTNTIDIQTSGLEYILAKYEPIGREPNGQRTVSFELNQSCLDKGRYPFLISAPMIHEQEPVEISGIDIRLEGKNIKQIIETLWKRRGN
jgi:hypothetical protein